MLAGAVLGMGCVLGVGGVVARVFVMADFILRVAIGCSGGNLGCGGVGQGYGRRRLTGLNIAMLIMVMIMLVMGMAVIVIFVIRMGMSGREAVCFSGLRLGAISVAFRSGSRL